MTVVEIPLVDFGLFLYGSPNERKHAAEELVNALRNHGFVRLKNHGISNQFVQELWDWNRKFFHLPTETKMKCQHIPGPDPQRGWTRKGIETTSALHKLNKVVAPKGKGPLTDEKEHFDCGPPGDTEFPNKFLSQEDFPGHQQFIERWFSIGQETALQIMRALEVGFGIPENSLVERCIPAASELRMLCYPPVSRATLDTGVTKRAWPHTDFGLITLLFQDSIGGLECEDRRKPYTFLPIHSTDASTSELIVNSSDTLTRWTNGVITSGVHQVNVPPSMIHETTDGQKHIDERHSTAFFFKAHRDCNVGPLKQFVTEDNPAQFSDISALEFHRERTQTIYADY